MILIFGGAYQGKTDFAKSEFAPDRIWDCEDGDEPDFSADCICNIDKFVLRCVKDRVDAGEYFRERASEWENKILVITDASQGVVPVDGDIRAFREMNGRLMVYLAGQAERVFRVFCGIGREIK